MNILLASLLIACLALIQCLAGGTRLVFAFPPYAIAAVAAVLSLIWIRRPSVKFSRDCLISTLLLAGYTFWRAWESPVAYLARPDAFMIGGALLVYLLTTLYLTNSTTRLWIVAALLVVAAVHVCVGLIQFRDQNGFMLFGFLRGDDSWRASGMLICGNHLSGYLEAAALLALGVTVWSRLGAGFKLVTGYMALFCYLGVIISGSRGGILSSILSLLVFGLLCIWVVSIYTPRNFVFYALGILAAVILFVGVSWNMAQQSTAIRNRIHKIETSLSDMRVYLWMASLDQYRLNPAWGTGAGTYFYYGRLFRRTPVQYDPVHVHGDYLEMLAEYGMVGEFLAFTFLLTHLASGLRSIREITTRRLCNAYARARSDSLALSLGSTAAVVALMAHSLVDFNMHIPGNALLFAFIFGMLGNPGTDRPSPTPSWLSGTVLLRAGLAALGVVMLAALAQKFKGEVLAEKSRIALRNLKYQEAANLAARAIHADPSNFYPYLYQGEAYRIIALRMQIPFLQPAFFEKAADSFRKGLEIFPQDSNFWLKLGRSLDGTHHYEEAGEAYLNALRWDPNYGYYYAHYATHLDVSGQPEAAKKYRQAAQQMGVKDADQVGKAEKKMIVDSGL